METSTYQHNIPPEQLRTIKIARERAKIKKGQVVWNGKKFEELEAVEKLEYLKQFERE